MITRIFTGRNELLQYIIVVAFSVLIFYVPVTIESPSGFSPLYEQFYNLIASNSILIKAFFVVLIAGPIIFTQVFLEYLGIVDRNNKYLLLLAPMLMFSIPSAWVLSPALISLAFIVIGTSFIFKISENDNSIKKLSSAGMFFSIGSLFYSINIFSVVVLIIAINIFRQVSLRDIMAVIFSFVLPYVYIFTYYFAIGEFEIRYQEFINIFSTFGFKYNFQLDTFQWVFFISYALISIFMIFSVIANLRNSLIQVRKYVSFFFWGLLNTAVLFLFINEYILQHFIILMYLLSLFYVFFLNKKKKNWIFDILLSIFLIYDLVLIYNLIVA